MLWENVHFIGWKATPSQNTEQKSRSTSLPGFETRNSDGQAAADYGTKISPSAVSKGADATTVSSADASKARKNLHCNSW
jgi:hypothetical protein